MDVLHTRLAELGATALRRSGAVRRLAVAGWVLAGLLLVSLCAASLGTGDPNADRAAKIVGHGGGLILIGLLAGLGARCLRDLFGARELDQITPVARFTSREKWIVFLGAPGLQFFLLYFAFVSTGNGSPGEFLDVAEARLTAPAGDPGHYLSIAEHGYPNTGDDQAYRLVFFPLYPALIWLVHFLTGSYAAGGLLISWVCWGGACVTMLLLAGHRYDRERAVLATLLMALYPFSFFSVGVYTESLFLLISLQCLLRIERRQWTAVGVLGMLAGLCRTQGLALLVPIAFAWLMARREGTQGRASLLLLLAPTGYGSFLLINKIVSGEWFAYVDYQRAAPFFQEPHWIAANLIQQYGQAQNYPGLAPFIYVPNLVLFFVALALLIYGLAVGAPRHLLLYAVTYLGISYSSGWLNSGGRYMFACVPLFLLAARPRSTVWQRAAPVLFAMVALNYAALFMQGQSIM